MSTIQKFEDILSWIEARELNEIMGKLIDENRFKSNYRLINQIEGAAGSVMDNIAEGFERGGNKELVQFLFIAKGSCGELRSQLYRAIDRKYLSVEEFNIISEKVKKVSGLIQKFINYLKQTELKGVKYAGTGNNANKR